MIVAISFRNITPKIFGLLINKFFFLTSLTKFFISNLFSQQLEALGSLHTEANTVHMSLSTLGPLLCYWSLVDTEIQTWYHWNWAKSLNFTKKINFWSLGGPPDSLIVLTPLVDPILWWVHGGVAHLAPTLLKPDTTCYLLLYLFHTVFLIWEPISISIQLSWM